MAVITFLLVKKTPLMSFKPVFRIKEKKLTTHFIKRTYQKIIRFTHFFIKYKQINCNSKFSLREREKEIDNVLLLIVMCTCT